jgi:hypothetical protein
MPDNDHLPEEPQSNFHIILLGSIILIGLMATLLLVLLAYPLPSLITTVAVPAENIPAYHLIEPSDLTNMSILALLKPEHALQNTSEAIGRYTLVQLSKDSPIVESTLSERDVGAVDHDMVRVDILVPNTMVEGSMPGKGEIADIYLLSDPANKSQNVFRAMILDIQKIQGKDGLEQNILIVALPEERLSDYINSSFYTKVKVIKNSS